ncbi:hypothetical protein D1872_277610 [compost metagenome]
MPQVGGLAYHVALSSSLHHRLRLDEACSSFPESGLPIVLHMQELVPESLPTTGLLPPANVHDTKYYMDHTLLRPLKTELVAQMAAQRHGPPLSVA